MKRSDITTDALLTAVDKLGTAAWTHLAGRYPPKLLLSAIERDVRGGYLEYGVSPTYPWLTEKGRAKLLGVSL
jgi:hypothetical protein